MVLYPVEQGVSGSFSELNTMSLLSWSAQSLCASNKRGADVRSLKAKGMEVPLESSSFLLTPWTWERELGITSLLSPSCVQVHQSLLTGLLGWAESSFNVKRQPTLHFEGKEPGGRGLIPLAHGVKAMWPHCNELKGHLGQYRPLDQDLGAKGLGFYIPKWLWCAACILRAPIIM